MTKYNTQNLVPITSRTLAERKEIAKKGAEVSNRKQKEKKTFQSTIQALLDAKIPAETLEEIKKKHPNISEKITYRELLVLAQLKQAILENDAKSFEIIRDTCGEIIRKDDTPAQNNFYINIVKNENLVRNTVKIDAIEEK